MKLPFHIDLTGKVAVVTGGGGVLCGEFAKALAACGAHVAVLDLKYSSAEKVANDIQAEGGSAIGLSANVLERDSLEQARAVITKEWGGCDILINGAGGNHPKGTTSKEWLEKEDILNADPKITTFFDLDPQGIEFVFNLNFLGTLLPSQVFAKDMIDRKGATIINISSMNAFTPLTKIPAYSAAKAAVSNFTQWLAVHLSKVGIRVNAIAPGFFLTQQNTALILNPDGSYTDRGKKIVAGTPMDRLGRTEELVGTLLWLVNEEATSFVTGVVIPVDGGFSAYSGV